MSYTTEENHFSTSVSEFPEYVSSNRSVSDFSTRGVDQEGAYKDDGYIKTGSILN